MKIKNIAIIISISLLTLSFSACGESEADKARKKVLAQEIIDTQKEIKETKKKIAQIKAKTDSIRALQLKDSIAINDSLVKKDSTK